jgi:transcriptional regulator with XRE-family HTH domain
MATRQWLLQLRNNYELTQKQVARLAGISRSYYSEIEVGAKSPSGKTAKRIADVLDFNMALFFEDQRRIKRRIGVG